MIDRDLIEVYRGRLASVNSRIAAAAKRRGIEPHQVTLVAVSKKQNVHAMKAMAECLREIGRPVVFGENYLQELERKAPELPIDTQLHFIGSLQSNKVKDALRYASVIESVGSQRILEIVKREKARYPDRSIYLQVNVSNDAQKSGVGIDQIDAVMEWCRVNKVSLTGLMTITEYYDNVSEVRGDYATLARLKEEFLARYGEAVFPNRVCELSMGMSRDFEIAIEEGATVVRVGTALFGER